jgi:hypothetical protein
LARQVQIAGGSVRREHDGDRRNRERLRRIS